MEKPIALIKDVIARFGPRRAGSEAETKAQEYLKEKLGEFTDSVELDVFKDALRAKFSSLKLFCLGFYLALWLPSYSSSLALLVAFVNGFLFLFHFVMYYNWLDFLFPKIESRNVTATIEPQERATSTLIFAGHMDSTPEFIWWYWLKDWGVRLMLIGGVSFAILPVYYLVSIILGYEIWMNPIWWFFVITSPFSLTFFFIHGSRVVDGAQDNLSGVAVAYSVGQHLASKRLKNTRIKVVSFGAEETGLKGSSAYAKKHKSELAMENAHLINLDGILEIDEMHIIEKELSLWQDHNPILIEKIGQAFERNGLKKKLGTIPIGATDASSFSSNDLPAVSIVGMNMDHLHPTYHTRLDTVECLEPSTLDKMVEVLVDFAQDWDKSS